MATVGTAFRDILLAMKAKLQGRVDAGEVFPADDTGVVYVTSRMNPPALDGKKSLVLVPIYQMFDAKSQEGHSRAGTFKKARVDIYFRLESELDQTYQDDTWLLGPYGFYAVLDLIEDTFDIWNPLKDDGTPMLTQPMRCIMGNEPRKNYQDHTRGDGMVEIEMEFQALRTTDNYGCLRAAP